MNADELVAQGKPDEALAALQAQIRAKPQNAKLRVFLFQLLCIQGDWKRALDQLEVAAQLDAANLLMAKVCGPAIRCELLRAEVFDGKRSPLILGEPTEWIGYLVQACQLAGQGKLAEAAPLREKAFELAPPTLGRIRVGDDPQGAAFDWIADMDTRLGPVLEAIVDGKYYWIPWSRVKDVRIEAPTDLRDLIWLPAHFRWSAGGEGVGFVPVRYPGSEASPDPGVRMSRKTDWEEPSPGLFVGFGQRMLATDKGEFALLDVRAVTILEAGAA
ncbi:MAG: virulence protein SciE type [Phycisphaerae bacterium]|nr:virulence protein SciE type [Phycisphaerae bacterium]